MILMKQTLHHPYRIGCQVIPVAGLQVSDPHARFKIFHREFSSGDIVLGGNLAQGAIGADVAYIAIVVEK